MVKLFTYQNSQQWKFLWLLVVYDPGNNDRDRRRVEWWSRWTVHSSGRSFSPSWIDCSEAVPVQVCTHSGINKQLGTSEQHLSTFYLIVWHWYMVVINHYLILIEVGHSHMLQSGLNCGQMTQLGQESLLQLTNKNWSKMTSTT